MALLSLNNVEVVYDRVFLAVKGVSIEVPEAGLVALVCTENLNTGVVVMKSAQDGAYTDRWIGRETGASLFKDRCVLTQLLNRREESG
jgi:hypothetical protein